MTRYYTICNHARSENGSQKATLLVVVLVVVGISSLKIPKAFLIRSGAQRNFAHTFVLTLSPQTYCLRFPLIFELMSSYSYSYSYRVTLFNELFSEESCSVIGLSEKMGLQL